VLTEAPSRPALGRLYALALLTQFIWALNNNVSKFALQGFPPLLLAGFRTALAAVLILPIYYILRARLLHARELPKLIALGAIGVGMNQFFFVVGINWTSVTHSAFILPLTPVITMLMAAALKQEKITRAKVMGMAIAFTGVLLLQLTKPPGQGATLLGDMLLLVGVLSFASYIVLGKRATALYDGITVTTVAYVGSALILSPLTIWQARGFDFSSVPLRSWLAVGYMALFSSIAGYLIYYYVLTHIESSRASNFSYAQPVMSTSLAALLLGEPVTLWLLFSGALVLTGVWVTERSRWA
jgi:drug/metabolite transporter (DMT)-like permease